LRNLVYTRICWANSIGKFLKDKEIEEADVARYRPAIKIVLRILECISRNQSKGRALKTHVIQCANLKTTSAEKYIDMLKEAGYILEKREGWGERTVIVYELTDLGKERFDWFRTINIELFRANEWLE
jgi:predicted transcriptional regulator